MKQLISGLMILAGTASQAGISVNQYGTGDVVLLPHYTVKNSNNSIITINNHNENFGKAVQLVFREGVNGENVLSFNLYLQPNDSWSGVLVAAISDVLGHGGEATVELLSNDLSCAPYLSSPQQFLPFGFEANETTASTMERVQEGFIEVYEMAQFDPGSEEVNFSECAEIEQLWDINGEWESGNPNFQMQEPQGDISANLTIINVNEGTSISSKGTALVNFFEEGSAFHQSPGIDYSLNDGINVSSQLTQVGLVETVWEFGYQAVSALLIKNKAEFDFSLETSVNAQAEAVITFPTKRFHTSGANPTAPFTTSYVEQSGACEPVSAIAVDRDGSPLPVSAVPENLCWANNVISMKKDNGDASQVFGSQYEYPMVIDSQGETGHVVLTFDNSVSGENALDTENEWSFTGLPFLGFSVQKYTNANAQPGLLAQYSSGYDLVSSTQIEAQ
jgi:hypothetical protein